jgi:hypothetical protein
MIKELLNYENLIIANEYRLRGKSVIKLSVCTENLNVYPEGLESGLVVRFKYKGESIKWGIKVKESPIVKLNVTEFVFKQGSYGYERVQSLVYNFYKHSETIINKDDGNR